MRLYTGPPPLARPAAARINAAPGVRPKRTMRDHLHENAIWNGAIAQLGERFNGIEEVVGSIPSGSTKIINKIAKTADDFFGQSFFLATD